MSAHKTVIRVVVIEGEADWVLETWARSIVPWADSVARYPEGQIRCVMAHEHQGVMAQDQREQQQ